MLMRTPVTGTVIDVAEDKAEFYLGQGFQRVAGPEPKKKAAPRKATAKKPKKEQ